MVFSAWVLAPYRRPLFLIGKGMNESQGRVATPVLPEQDGWQNVVDGASGDKKERPQDALSENTAGCPTGWKGSLVAALGLGFLGIGCFSVGDWTKKERQSHFPKHHTLAGWIGKLRLPLFIRTYS